MFKLRCIFLLCIFSVALQGVIRRHDCNDHLYKTAAKDENFSCIGLVQSSLGFVLGTGTLIDNQTVLTVGHSLVNRQRVLFCMFDVSGKWISAGGTVQVHEEFSQSQRDLNDEVGSDNEEYSINKDQKLESLHNDIALIHLHDPVYCRVLPRLSVANPKRMVGVHFISAGFGASGNGKEGPSFFFDYKKRACANQIIALYQHSGFDKLWISSLFKSPKTELDGLLCYGDSGAPIFLKGSQSLLNEESDRDDEEDSSFPQKEGPLMIGFNVILIGNGHYGSKNGILPLAYYKNWIQKNASSVIFVE